ncbi:2-oxo-4-hydroxy-4-carboxy-5-ureidoimidazoline decarboxylase [Tropicimonas sp. IMCC6043]|nr:2-oxo-4-hydroxy-4-carboxy-5-ureidoimidazoline decarboxylase [Tropicimonas sp. IMCC6043]
MRHIARVTSKTTDMTMNTAINALNSAQREQALLTLIPLVERSPWVAEVAVDQRPFASDGAVAEALVEVILSAPPERRLALFNVHPELAGPEVREGYITAESASEQGRLGLTDLPESEARRLRELNASYRARFGHPFIIALHRVPDRNVLFEIFEKRLKATRLEEHTTTLAEIASVIQSRCDSAFGSPPSNIPNRSSSSPSQKQETTK